ncbi:MAG: DUF3460 family protein [Burkholderiales bacterium]|nr:DUF3460 family protein [Burkholderiales bacterium]
MYESDLTRFMRELRQQKPHIAIEQQRGRALLWDRQLDREELRQKQAARVAQQAYVYQTKV